MKLIFDETMQGFVHPGEVDYEQGYKRGREKNFDCSMDVTICIEDVDSFINLTEHGAGLTGTVSVPGLGQRLSIRDGIFNLFRIEENKELGRTQKTMEYSFCFQSELGETYYFYGRKNLFHDPGKIDILEDMTTLYSSIYKGETKNPSKLYAGGILHFAITDSPALIQSIRVEGASSLEEQTLAISKFFDFAFEESLEIYFNRLVFFYRTDYQNLVLAGPCRVDNCPMDFFLYGGAHDQGFPWGDAETFWDMGIILNSKNKDENNTTRYVIAATTLVDQMKLDVGKGHFRYSGKLYRLKKGYALSFSGDMKEPAKSELLEEVEGKLEIDFVASKPEQKGIPVPAVVLPFAVPEALNNPFLLYVHNTLQKWFPSRHELGIHLGVRSVSVTRADILVDGKSITLACDQVCGEAENSTFNSVREPTLYYNYFCGIDPEQKMIRVYVEGDVLFNDTIYPLKNMFDHALRLLVKPCGSMELRIKGNRLTKLDKIQKPLKIKDDYILEVNFDHFETGVFQRRVVRLSDETGRSFLALEEDMKRINLRRILPASFQPTNSPLDRERSTVAVFKSSRAWPASLENPERDRPGFWDNLASLFNLHKEKIRDAAPEEIRREAEDQDKKLLLRKVIQVTRLIGALDQKASELGKRREDLSVVIKPSFMFLYNKADHTTYTDPVLVLELIDVLHSFGFHNIYVAEAQSTYGEYFQNRDVASVASYIGLKTGDKYKVVDLSDSSEWIEPDPPFQGPLAGEKVHRVWANADFRISFAKNKTHCYAYYTLTLKNIYGALPSPFKFKEYHCKRGIYETTIEYLSRFPAHFGFIDAYVSADGPFGIFADKTPNYTRTIIGGENLVAVDWVASSKMGLDPMISEYMKKAVERFGKPRIDLVGDLKEEVYTPWENVPMPLSWSTHSIIDKHFEMGNIFYSAFSNMDEKAFPRKSDTWLIKLSRLVNRPIRDMFFKQESEAEKKVRMKRLYMEGPFSAYGDPEQDL